MSSFSLSAIQYFISAIKDVTIGENQETPAIAHYAFEALPAQIVEHQTLQLDAVSGATLSSFAVKNAVKDALEQAGLDPQNYQTPIEYETHEETIDTDIVIVGAGGSGLSAAIEAAQAGASVTVVEADVYPGGATMYSGGMVLYAATEQENLEEERTFLEWLELPDCYFWAVHPLDSVKIEGTLRENKQRMLDKLAWSIEHIREDTISRTSRTGTL